MTHSILSTIAIAGWAAEILLCLFLWASTPHSDRWMRTLTIACTIEAVVFDPLKVIFIFKHGLMALWFSPLHLTELVTLGLIYGVCLTGRPRALGMAFRRPYSSR